MRKAAVRHHHETAMVCLCCLDSQNWKLAEVLRVTQGLQDSQAMLTLGLMYLEAAPSSGFTKDVQKSIQWFEKAARAGNERAVFQLSKIYWDNSDYQDSGKGMQWLMYGIAQGFPLCQYELGMAHIRGKWGLAVDKVAGFGWISSAASHDFPPALVSLGYLYERGLGVPIDAAKAFRCYHRAIVVGEDAAAMYQLSLLYKDGRGCLQNDNLHLYWCRRAALLSFPDAVNMVMSWYRVGNRNLVHDMKEIQERLQ